MRERGAPAEALPWLDSCTRTSCQLVNSEPPSTCLQEHGRAEAGVLGRPLAGRQGAMMAREVLSKNYARPSMQHPKCT